MRRLLTALIIALSSFWATWLWAQTGTPLTKNGVNAAINSNFPDNTTGAITPFLLRQGLFDIVSSMQQYGCVHALTATTYTALSTDYGCLLTFSNSNPMTLSLPAGPTINPFNIFVSNYGGGNLTITPAAGTIAGLGSFTLGSGAGLWIVNDGTNWQIFRGSGGSGSGGLLIGEAINGSSPGGLLYNTNANLLADDGPFIVSTFPPLLSNGQWSIGSTTAGGAILIGQGSTNDIQLENSAGGIVMAVPTSSGSVNFPSLQTGGVIANALCSTATGTVISSLGANCFGAGGGGTPGGVNTQVQFNTMGSFGGISGMTSDGAAVNINTATIVNLSGTNVNLTGNLTGTTAQFTGAVTGTTAKFQTMTVTGLTPTGPNCLQETGGIIQATNSSCSSGGGTPGGSNTQVQFNTNSSFGGISGVTSDGAAIGISTATIATLTAGTVRFTATASGTTAQFNTFTGATLNLTGNLTGTTAQFSGAVTGTTAQFNTYSASTASLIALAGSATYNVLTAGGNISGLSSIRISSTNSNNGGIADIFMFGETGNYAGFGKYGSLAAGNYGSTGIAQADLGKLTSKGNGFLIGTDSGSSNGNVYVISNGTLEQVISTTSTSFSAAINIPAIAQLATTTNGYVCWTTGTGALSEDSTTCLASLRALKMNINPFGGATTELMALKPSTFRWRDPIDRNQTGLQLGFVAEDVASVDPKLASYIHDGSLHGWRQDGMIALLVRGFQEQQQEIATLKAQLRSLGR